MKPSLIIFRKSGTVFLLLAALTFLVGSIWLGFHSRLEVVEGIVLHLKQPERYELLSNQYLTPDRFLLLQIASVSAFLVCLLLAYLFQRNSETLWFYIRKGGEALREFQHKAKQSLQKLSREERLLAFSTFLLLLFLKVWLANWFTAHTDEAYSYLHFVREGFIKTIAYYPLPNNHVFYNFLSGFLFLFKLPPLWVIRPVTFLASLLLSVLLFLIGLRRSNFTTAYLLSVFFSAAPYSLYYSVNGRGYMLLSFFAVLAGYAVLRFCETYRNRYLVIFILSTAFGFFTVPVFAYCFLPLVLFGGGYLLRYGNSTMLFRLAGALTLALGLTVLLYGPILLTSGWHVFLGKDVQQQAGKDFSSNFGPYLQFLFTRFSGWGMVGYMLPLLAFLGLFRQKKNQVENKKVATLLFVMLLSSIVLVAVSRVLPPERTWLFWTISGAAVMAAFVNRIFEIFRLDSIKAFYLTALFGFGFVALQFFNLKAKVVQGEIQVFWPLPRIIPEVVNSKAQHVYSEYEFYELYMLLGRSEKKATIDIDVYSLDASKNYDYVLILKDKPFPPALAFKSYEFVFSDHLVKAYRRRDLKGISN